jgi:hypothetical protein
MRIAAVIAVAGMFCTNALAMSAWVKYVDVPNESQPDAAPNATVEPVSIYNWRCCRWNSEQCTSWEGQPPCSVSAGVAGNENYPEDLIHPGGIQLGAAFRVLGDSTRTDTSSITMRWP